MSELAERLETVKHLLDQPLTRKERKMAKKKLAKKTAPAANATASETASAEPAAEDNRVSLATLSEEVGITPQAARRKLRASNLVKDGRWAWPEDSDELEEAREVISKAEEKEEAAAA